MKRCYCGRAWSTDGQCIYCRGSEPSQSGPFAEVEASIRAYARQLATYQKAQRIITQVRQMIVAAGGTVR